MINNEIGIIYILVLNFAENESQQAIAGTPKTSHQCPWCDTIYSLKRNLTSHLRTKHPLESKETTNANTRSSAKRRRE